MRRAGIALVAAAFLGCRPLPPAGPVPARRAEELPRLVLHEQADAAAVLVRVSIAAGSVYDPPGGEGLASLTARAMVRGAAGGVPAEEVARRLDAWGGGLDLQVGPEVVTWQLACPVEAARDCVDLLVDLLVAPDLEPGELEVLRAEAGAVLGATDAPPELLAARVLGAWIFEGHPYGHPAEGREGVLSTLDAARVQAFRAARVVRETVVFGLAGPVDPGVLAHLTARSAALPPRRAAEVALMRPAHGGEAEVLAVRTAASRVAVRAGHAVRAAPGSRDAVALALGLATLGAAGGHPSRTAGLAPLDADGALGVPTPGQQRRQVVLELGLEPLAPEEVGPALLELADDVRRLAAQGPEARALAVARARLLRALDARASEPAWRLADAVDVVAGAPGAAAVRAALHSLSDADVAAALAEHLHADALRVVAVGPIDGVGEDLARAGASPGRSAAALHVRDAAGIFR